MTVVPIEITTEKAFTAWKWCKENGIETNGIQKPTGLYYFEFKTEEDAIAFKLRWI